MRARLKEIKEELRRRMHRSIPEQGKWLRQVVTGYFAYHAVPTNSRALNAFRHHVSDLWRRSLQRRSQKDRTTWERITSWSTTSFPNLESFIPGRKRALPSNTRGGSRVPKLGTLGSVRGAVSNDGPDRDRNIGAHMEKDIDLIIDVDPVEAQTLLELVETLFVEWYVARHDREQRFSRLAAIADDNKAQRKPNNDP